MEVEAEKVYVAYKKFKHLLTEKEIDVLSRFYGIDQQVRHSLQEIADKYKVTRERIRQIKSEALIAIKFKANK